jgi:hypothetical protein
MFARVMQILASGGGYMLASVHANMHDVLPENMLAMLDAGRIFTG